MKKIILAAAAALTLCATSAQAEENQKPNMIEVSTYDWMRMNTLWVNTVNMHLPTKRYDAIALCKVYGKVEAAFRLQRLGQAMADAYAYGPMYGINALSGIPAKMQPDVIDRQILQNCADIEHSTADMVNLF